MNEITWKDLNDLGLSVILPKIAIPIFFVFCLLAFLRFIFLKVYYKRIYIYDFIKKAYILRSKIAHGERSNALDIQKFIELRELTRKSLIYFLENKDNWDGKKLDRLILETNSINIDCIE